LLSKNLVSLTPPIYVEPLYLGVWGGQVGESSRESFVIGVYTIAGNRPTANKP
jgi:hypothetical protein